MIDTFFLFYLSVFPLRLDFIELAIEGLGITI